ERRGCAGEEDEGAFSGDQLHVPSRRRIRDYLRPRTRTTFLVQWRMPASDTKPYPRRLIARITDGSAAASSAAPTCISTISPGRSPASTRPTIDETLRPPIQPSVSAVQ